MTLSGNEGDQPRAMYFQLRYITADFDFGNKQIRVSHPEKKMDFLLRKRIPDDAPLPPLKPDDGFVTVTCEREITERLQQEAISSGQLSIKKGAIRIVHDDMVNHLRRTLRLIRWRANSHGRPNPLRSLVRGKRRYRLMKFFNCGGLVLVKFTEWDICRKDGHWLGRLRNTPTASQDLNLFHHSLALCGQ
jgi:hypothetical protein